MVACTGMGGVGKSQLLTYLVHSKALQEGYKHIYWFQAADKEESLLQQYHGLAQELKLPGVDEKTPVGKAKAALLGFLEKEGASTLLVFDNADEPKLLERFLPQSGCQTLVSSRSPNWKNKVGVDVFTPDQVGELLTKLLPDQNTTLEEATRLGEVLGYLPLALNQAIAWIRQEGTSLTEYVTSYEEKQKELLKTSSQLYGKNLPHSMVTLYQMQLGKLSKLCPEAIILLEYTSLLAPDNIPLALLNKGLLILPPPDKMFLDKVLLAVFGKIYAKAEQTLLQYALWQEDKGTGSIRMHRLMQEVVKLPFTDEKLEERYLVLADHIKNEYNEETTVLADEARNKVLVPHLEALAQLAEKRHTLTNCVQFGKILGCIGYYYQYQKGDYSKACKLYEQALEINTKHLGEDHPETGLTLMNLGNVYGGLGKYEKQKNLLEKALEIFKKHCGEDNPQIGITLGNLGNAYGSLGNYEKQKEILEKSLEIFKKHYGENHPIIGVTLGNLGNAYGYLGNYEKHKELLETALEIQIKHLGEDHPSTGTILNDLGNAYGGLGNYEKQKEVSEKALEIFKKHYGEDHPKTGITLMNLGNAHGYLGNYEKKKNLLEIALEIQIKHWGEDHSETGKTLTNLGNAYGALGKYEKQKKLLEKALEIFKKHYGEDHPETGITLTGLGNTYEALHDPKKALQYYQQAYNIFVTHNHPYAASVKRRMHVLTVNLILIVKRLIDELTKRA